jgi:hypothetical protein
MDYTKTTTMEDLYDLASKLGIKNIKICRKHELKKYLKKDKFTNYIINLDDLGGGSHWVSANTSKKIYFDSYATKAPLAIPKDYKQASTFKELQSIESTDCGGLCCLWLYYINNKTNAEYYSLFKDVYA